MGQPNFCLHLHSNQCRYVSRKAYPWTGAVPHPAAAASMHHNIKDSSSGRSAPAVHSSLACCYPAGTVLLSARWSASAPRKGPSHQLFTDTPSSLALCRGHHQLRPVAARQINAALKPAGTQQPHSFLAASPFLVSSLPHGQSPAAFNATISSSRCSFCFPSAHHTGKG